MDQEISRLQYCSNKSQKSTTQRKYKKRKCKSKAHLFSKSDILLFISFIIMSHLRNSKQKAYELCERKKRSCSISDTTSSSYCLLPPWSHVAILLKENRQTELNLNCCIRPGSISVCLWIIKFNVAVSANSLVCFNHRISDE